jgi:hypothetical protein
MFFLDGLDFVRRSLLIKINDESPFSLARFVWSYNSWIFLIFAFYFFLSSQCCAGGLLRGLSL